ncbi:unnamed protein product [Trifolium pratense]|uniref:Uncharacterized protein n=1 Tax=Trifolium pratense TaxID=57577 RepID=A0ACB0JY80_TRIPR|nr:unnamed protein product [Trifolium pratense]
MAASISFVIPSPTFLKPKFRSSSSRIRKTVVVHCSCSQPQQHNHDQQQSPTPTPLRKKNEKNKLGKLAMIAVAAGVLTFGSISVNVDDALAAKTGGRIGGQSFRSSAPRPSSPRINNNNNSRTNIYINPRVAPPLGGGYGYGGVPYYGGGWGWSPFSFFAPGPSVAVGVGGGFDTILLFMFFGAAAAVVRRFFGSRNVEDDDDDY